MCTQLCNRATHIQQLQIAMLYFPLEWNPIINVNSEMRILNNRRHLSPNFALLKRVAYSFSLICIFSIASPCMQLTSLNRNTINQVEIALIAFFYNQGREDAEIEDGGICLFTVKPTAYHRCKCVTKMFVNHI